MNTNEHPTDSTASAGSADKADPAADIWSQDESGERLVRILQGIKQARDAGLVMINGKTIETHRGVAWESTLSVDGKRSYRITNEGVGGCSSVGKVYAAAPAVSDVARRLMSIELFGKALVQQRAGELATVLEREERGEKLNAWEMQAKVRLMDVNSTGFVPNEDDLCELLEMYAAAMEEWAPIARKAKKHLLLCVAGKPRYLISKWADSPQTRARPRPDGCCEDRLSQRLGWVDIHHDLSLP